MSHYQKSHCQLKHVYSWFKAAEARKYDILIEGVVFEPDTEGLVRAARGWVNVNQPFRIGRNLVNRPILTRVTWSYLGKCTDWTQHRLAQYDLDIKETPIERQRSLEEWKLDQFTNLVKPQTP